LPLRINFHFYYTPDFFVRDIDGLAISAFDCFLLLVLALWLFRVVSDHRLKVRLFPAVSIPFAIIWLLSLAGLLRAGVDTPIAVAVLWTVFKNLLVFLYVANNLDRLGPLKHILIMLLLIGVVQSGIGIAQYATGGKIGLAIFGEAERAYFEMRAGDGHVSRVAGTLGHPNKLAVFLNMLLLLNLAMLFAAPSRRARRLLLVPMAIMGVAMLLTFSRGGWLGLTLGGGLTLFWCLFRIVRHRTLTAVILLVAAGAVLVTTFAAVPAVRQRLFEDDYGTAALRVPMSQVAVNIMAHHPWLGVGLNNYTAVSKQYDNSFDWVSYAFHRPVHNEFLLIGAEQGVIVLALFLAILGRMLFYLYRIATSRAPLLITTTAIGFLGGWLGWCLHHQFEYSYTFFSATVWLLFGLIQAMHQGVRAPSPKMPEPGAA
jgi:putative inorganic carbon (hco3(-)) transporter